MINKKEKKMFKIVIFVYIQVTLIFRDVWEQPKIVDPSLRMMTATLGPSGGKKGFQGLTGKYIIIIFFLRERSENEIYISKINYCRYAFIWTCVVYKWISNT